MKLSFDTFQLRFRDPFTISKGTKTHQPTFIVTLEQFGLTGYGEAPAISYYQIPLEKMAEDFEQKKASLEKYAFTEPDRYWHFLHHLIPHNPFLVCALDMAAWDLFGKLRKKPVYACWNLDMPQGPITDFTIGIDTPEEMLRKMNARPWPLYKIKLGTPQDADILRRLRQHTQATIRVDANAGWTLDQALALIPVLAECGVETD